MSANNDQRQNRGRERAEAAGGGTGDAPGSNNIDNGNNSVNVTNNRAGPARPRPRRPRRIVRAPPPPYWHREDGGRMERVDRTPLNVLLFDLDDPFPEENDDGGGEGGVATRSEDHDSVNSDSSESDDENNLVDPNGVVEPGLAAYWLSTLRTKYRRYRLRELVVSCGDNDLLGDPNDLPADVRQFVTDFKAYGRIRTLNLTRFNFGRNDDNDPEGGRGANEDGRGERGDFAWEGELGRDLSLLLDDGFLEDFFGSVLCNHRSLEEIAFTKSTIPTKYWRVLTDNLVSSTAKVLHLSLELTPLTMEHCQLLKRMFQRKARVPMLSIVDCGLGADEWRVVCEGIAESGGEVNYVILSEENGTVKPEMLRLLLHAPSTVETLTVCAPDWSEGAFEGGIRALRTNECLVDVTLEKEGDDELPDGVTLVEELLTTYNWTLKLVTLYPLEDASQARINALLERNQRVRRVEEQLIAYNRSPKGRGAHHRNHHQRVRALVQQGRPSAFERYHLSRKSLWPRVLEEYGRLPTLLYRFLRHGNLEELVTQVEAVASANAAAASLLARPRKKKERSPPMEEAMPRSRKKKERPPPMQERPLPPMEAAVPRWHVPPRRRRRRRNPNAISVLELMAAREAGVDPAAAR